MKVPKAKKLSSGNWRVQIQIDGKRYSCTGATKKEVQEKAKQLFAGVQMEKRIPMTVGKAIDRYIQEKTGTLSPSTLQGYKTIRKNYLQEIMKINLSDLSQGDIQMAVGIDSVSGKSPKTIRNAHGLLSAVLREYRPNFVLQTRLPQKKKYEARILTEDEMKKVWQAAKGSEYELPILLASWLGLRMSEIRGLKFKDVQPDGNLHICRAIVYGPDGDAEKGPKSISGDRYIKLPKEILRLIHNELGKLPETMKNEEIRESRICPYRANQIYLAFIEFCREVKIEPCRFHDLRHFAASEALALGIPDKYAMKRMGHKTDNMLKTVYQHTMKNKEDEFGDLIDRKMEELYKE